MSSSIADQRGQEFGDGVHEPLQRRAETPADHIADPGPLGLAGFAMTTFVLSVFNAGLLPTSLEKVVLPLALFYGGLAQLLAGMWEFRKANTFGALAFSSYGAFWLSFAAYVQFVAPGIPADSAGAAVGIYLLAWAIFTGYMTVASLRVTGAVAAVFVTLFITYVLLTIAEFAGAAGVGKAGGIVGIITAIVAWYASFAGVVNATWKRTVIPVWPLSDGALHRAGRPR